MDEKNMQFANFNITFGEQDSPMLEYFEEIIYPAFLSGYVRGNAIDGAKYSFDDIRIKEINDELVMVGNYIKSTEYKVITTVQDGALVSSPAEIPTAPYSRFVIFLKNHRMVLVRNEKSSPDVRSFQKTVRDMLFAYIRKNNRDREREDKLPEAFVNIVDIPMRDSIEEVLRNVRKVDSLKLRFFPLNNDLPPQAIAQAVLCGLQKVGSRTGNLVFNSPGSRDGVQNLIQGSGGMAEASLKVTDVSGEKRSIKQDTFSSNIKIQHSGNLTPNSDIYLVEQAKVNGSISTVSEENASLYERFVNRIRRLVG